MVASKALMAPSQPIKLYELASADERRLFSPYVWRIRMALAHKGLDFESVPWHFTEKEKIAFADSKTVPVLVDQDGKAVHESWDIAVYLEQKYADKPALFGGKAGMAAAKFVQNWVASITPLVAQLAMLEVHDSLTPEDKKYFRETREKMFGTTLEKFCADPESKLPELNKALEPLRNTLADQPFLGGDEPNYADYIVFGHFAWLRVISKLEALSKDDAVYAWRERLLDAHNGAARKVPAAAEL